MSQVRVGAAVDPPLAGAPISPLQALAMLGCCPGASQEVIRDAYRRLARRLHPDVNPSPEAAQKMAVATAAYDMLRTFRRHPGSGRKFSQGPPRIPLSEAFRRARAGLLARLESPGAREAFESGFDALSELVLRLEQEVAT